MEDIIHPGALESKAQIDEDLNEMREQLRKQLIRIRELRIKKVEEPGMRERLNWNVLQPHTHAMFSPSS